MSLNSFPNQETVTNLEKATKCLEALRTSELDEGDKVFIPETAWSYDEAGNFVAASIDDLVMCCAMSGSEDLEKICGELYDAIKAEEKSFLASKEKSPLTPEMAKNLAELFAPFTTEAINFLFSAELIWNDPKRFALRDEFRKLQSYILNLYKTTDISLRSNQDEPSVKDIMEMFILIRQAVGGVNADNTIKHDNLGTPPYETLIREG